MAAFGFLVALTLAFFSYLIAKIFKLPSLAILLVFASIVGPNGLGFVGFEEVSVFSSIGAMFLLFLIGLEFKTSSLIKYGLRGFIFAVVKMILVSLPIIYLSMTFFHLSSFESFIIGFALSITSTAIFSKLSKSLGIYKSKETKQLFSELIWEDIFAVFFLILITSYANTGNIESSFLLSLAYFTIPYFLVRKVSEFIVHRLPRDSEIYFLFSIAIAGVLVVISSMMNVPAELAAFLAGSIAANFKEVERIKKNLNVLGSTFMIFFFFSLGMNASLSVFFNSDLVLFIVFALVVNVIFKVFSTSIISFSLGGSARSSALSGLLMVSVGEFSLLIAKETSSLFSSIDAFSIISGVVFLSSLISWYSPNFFTVYADFISKFSKRINLVKKKKNKKLFETYYLIQKLEHNDHFSYYIDVFKVIESRVILSILLLFLFSYFPVWFPTNPYIISLSYLFLFFSLVLIISSLITLKKRNLI